MTLALQHMNTGIHHIHMLEPEMANCSGCAATASATEKAEASVFVDIKLGQSQRILTYHSIRLVVGADLLGEKYTGVDLV